MVLLSSLHALIKPAVLTRCHGQNRNVGVQEPPQLFFCLKLIIQLTLGFTPILMRCLGSIDIALDRLWPLGGFGKELLALGSWMEQLYLVLADNFLCACIIRVINWVPASEFQDSLLEFSYFKF